MEEQNVLVYLREQLGLVGSMEIAIKLGTFPSLGYAITEGQKNCASIDKKIGKLKKEVEDTSTGLDALLSKGPRQLEYGEDISYGAYAQAYCSLPSIDTYQREENKDHSKRVEELKSKKQKLNKLVFEMAQIQEITEKARSVLQKLTGK